MRYLSNVPSGAFALAVRADAQTHEATKPPPKGTGL